MHIDVFGDVHGCYDELCELLELLNYQYKNHVYSHPEERTPIFLGDITDRGPSSLQVIDLVYQMVIEKDIAKYIPGNHCNKLYRYFLGNNVKVQHGLETTVAEYRLLNTKAQKSIKEKFMRLYQEAPL